MLNTLKKSLFVALFMLCGSAHAELPQDYKVVLLTENFPPFNMAVDDKNFARDDGIDGISADIVREMFKRAGIDYTLTLRFPWDRLYRLTLDKPNYALFSTTYTEERKPLFKWVGPIAKTGWVLLAAPGSDIKVSSLKDAAKSLMDRAVDDREVILVRRRSGGDVAMIAADELESLIETAHLLRSAKNAERLLSALARARSETLPDTPLSELQSRVGFDA